MEWAFSPIANVLRDHSVHLFVGEARVVIDHHEVIGCFRCLLAEEGNDSLGVIVRHFGLVE